MTRFPHEILVLSLPADNQENALDAVIRHVVGLSDVSIVDALLVVTSAGKVADTVEIVGTEYDPGLTTTTPGLIGSADVTEIGSVMAPDDSAVVLLVEHVWVSRLATRLDALRGHWVASVQVPTEHVRAAETEIAENAPNDPGRPPLDRGTRGFRTVSEPLDVAAGHGRAVP